MVHRNRLRSSIRSGRRRRAVVSMGVAGALALSACAGKSTSTGTSSPVSNGRPITIGVSLSLTGDFSDSGKAAQRGYETWVDVVNANGGILGHKVVLKVVDDISSPNQVITDYQNLITKDHVDFVFGPFSSLLTVP